MVCLQYKQDSPLKLVCSCSISKHQHGDWDALRVEMTTIVFKFVIASPASVLKTPKEASQAICAAVMSIKHSILQRKDRLGPTGSKRFQV